MKDQNQIALSKTYHFLILVPFYETQEMNFLGTVHDTQTMDN